MKRLSTILLFAALCTPAWAASNVLTTNASSCPAGTNATALVVDLPQDKGGATLTISGTWTGTISFKATGDGGTTWSTLNAYPIASTTAVTSATANGTWQVNTAGFTGLCMLSTASMTGSATATITTSFAPFASKGGGTGGGITSINGDTSSAQTIAAGTGISVATSSGTTTITNTGSGSSAFNAITGGTNTTAAMVVGAGASLAPTSATAGTVSANQINGTALSSLATGITRNTTTTGAISSAELSGDATTSGSNAVTVVKVNGGSIPASAPVAGTNSSNQVIAAPLTSTQVWIGNGSNLPAAHAVSGDSTMTNTGLVTNTGLNGTLLSSLATGILKNTTTTGVPSIAVAGTDYQAPLTGTGLVRQSGAATELSGDATTSGSNAVTVVKVNGASVPTSATALASNGSSQLVAATYQGNGAKVQLSTGTTTTNDCVKFDANGNTVDAGAACGSGSGGSKTIPINLGVGQGAGGCSLAWSFLSATAPTCYFIAGSSTTPQFAVPQFTVAGAIGTGTALYLGPLTLPSNYTTNSNITVNLALASHTVVTGNVTFNVRYAVVANPAAVQPTFITTDYGTGAVSVAGTLDNAVTASAVLTSPTAAAGNQLYFVIYLNNMSAAQNPYISQMYVSY